MRERGAHGFSMDVLAKEAGVARATVYEHFRSKHALLDELASSTSRSLTLERNSKNSADPLAALRDMLGAVCRHWADCDEAVRELRTLVAVTGSSASADGIDPTYLRGLVEAIAASGQLRPRWSVDDAVDALAVLTSHPTYERIAAGELANAGAGRDAARQARRRHHLAGDHAGHDARGSSRGPPLSGE